MDKLQELQNKKDVLLKKTVPLIELKKKLYANIDVSLPMCEAEKQLNKEINTLFSQINKIILEIRAEKKAIK